MTNNKNKTVINSITLFLSILFLITGYHLTTEFINNKKYNLKDYIITEGLKPAFNKNNISVAFASDNNYVKYLSVAIVSLTDNMSKDYNYDIVILEDNIKDKNKRLLLKQIKDFKNISLRFIDINKYFKRHKDVDFYLTKHFTKSIYNRLFIPDIFKNYSKVIYLDCDILINSDLVDLYNINLGDNLIAGIHDAGNSAWLPYEISKNDYFYNYVQKKLGINDPMEYINSGVIIFNIEKCLRYNFSELCLNTLKKFDDLEHPDQDIINIVCNNHIKYLDYRYNFLVPFIYNEDFKKYIPKYVMNDIKIFHFAGHHPLNRTLYSDFIEKWIRISFKSQFFGNKEKQLRKFKIDLIRYKICGELYRSEKRLKKYKEKIKNVEKRIEFIKGIDK